MPRQLCNSALEADQVVQLITDGSRLLKQSRMSINSRLRHFMAVQPQRAAQERVRSAGFAANWMPAIQLARTQVELISMCCMVVPNLACQILLHHTICCFFALAIVKLFWTSWEAGSVLRTVLESMVLVSVLVRIPLVLTVCSSSCRKVS